MKSLLGMEQNIFGIVIIEGTTEKVLKVLQFKMPLNIGLVSKMYF